MIWIGALFGAVFGWAGLLVAALIYGLRALIQLFWALVTILWQCVLILLRLARLTCDYLWARGTRASIQPATSKQPITPRAGRSNGDKN